MEVVANSYLPGDPHLVDKIVYELKAQGIFDQFRKECFADVDTKPAYQNLRQRVEGSVAGFLKDQSWRPDMNKNQVREMLRKTITESGYLETGVERIVDQVVNPKINTIFLPKVEEVVYSYLGIKKPNKNEPVKSEQCDLLPEDLEAVSPESDHDKKEDKSTENLPELDESKTEDESPPFEPLDEQSTYVPQEENSVDSHLSGFSGLVSHESNQSNENKVTPMEQDSQMSRNSSDSRLSIVTSDENSKMEICEDSQPKSTKSNETCNKQESDKNKHKSSDRHKSRSESKSDRDRDRKSSKDSRSRHSSSSKDKDKSRDRKDSKSTSSSSKNDKDKPKEKSDKDKSKSSSSSTKHSSHNKDKNGKKESSKSDKDKKSSSSNHKDSKLKEKSSDSKTKEKSSYDKHRHSSSSSHSDKHKKDKDKENRDKKKDKSKDDHYSSKDKKNDRRSTDRDSNDGQSSKQNPSQPNESNSSQSQKSNQESSGGGDSGNSDQSEHTTKAPVIVTDVVEGSEVTISALKTQKLKLFKPKCASNMQEALRLRKIRKQLAKLEKKNQLCLTSVNLDSPILLNASINLDDLNQNCIDDEKLKQETLNNKIVAELKVVPNPLQNTVISQDNWDAMEAKLREEVSSEFKQVNDDSYDESIYEKSQIIDDDNIEDCKYFENVDIKKIEFLLFVEKLIKKVELQTNKTFKRKVDDTDTKNNNTKHLMSPDKKAKLLKKNKDKINNHSDLSVSEKFPLPLSPAESDKSFGKKEDGATIPLKLKRNSISKLNSQRYQSDDLYKPRPTFASSRRRGAKNLEN